MEVMGQMRTVSKTLTQVVGKTCMEVVRTKDHLQANNKTDMEGSSWKATRVISTRKSSSVALVAVVGEPGPSSQAEVFMVFQAVEMASSVMQLQTLSVAVAMALPLLRTAGITRLVTLQTVVVAIILQCVASRMHLSGMMPTEILVPATNEDA
jgi:hypothetical protein